MHDRYDMTCPDRRCMGSHACYTGSDCPLCGKTLVSQYQAQRETNDHVTTDATVIPTLSELGLSPREVVIRDCAGCGCRLYFELTPERMHFNPIDAWEWLMDANGLTCLRCGRVAISGAQIEEVCSHER